jgi:outer membrane lipoprotein-sorting protein
MSSYKNYQFNFKYALENTQENIKQETSGSIVVSAKKYKLITSDITQLFDGKDLYTIIPENEEVLISKPDQEDTAILNPTELIDIYKSGYDFHWDILQIVRGNKIQFVKLIPTEESQDVSYILLGINTKSKNIYKLIEVGKQRTTTTLTLENFVINKSISTDFFIFNDVDYPGFYIN